MSGPNSNSMNNTGIPQPTSLLSSYLFSQLSGGGGGGGGGDVISQRHQQQEGVPEIPSSLNSSALPPSLLNDKLDARSGHDGRIRPAATLSSSSAAATTNTTASIIPPRPRRLWNVQDTSLGPIPPYYPPMDPNCTTLVTDVPPSLVVVRISECLRKRSIAVEYDEESVTARCMTVDRTHFVIQLYRGSQSNEGSSSSNGGFGGGGENVTTTTTAAAAAGVSPPPSHVLVECQKQSGCAVSFHAACHAVLQAAKGMETGDDERLPHWTNGMEFITLKSRCNLYTKRRKLSHQTTAQVTTASNPSTAAVGSRILRPPSLNYAVSTSFPAAEAALEAARELIEKDRLECQQLGMERLINLTTMDISGEDISLYISRRLIQPIDGDDESAASWLIDFLMHPEAELAMDEAAAGRKVRGGTGRKGNIGNNDSTNVATANAALIRSFLETSAALTPTPKLARHLSSKVTRRTISGTDVEDMGCGTGPLSSDELRHDSLLRAMALRVLCNALYNLSKARQLQEALLPSAPIDSPSTKRKSRNSSLPSASREGVSRLVRPSFLLSLVQDMQGASRPPSVSETGYKLASVHEAVLAIRCLRLLAGAATNGDTTADDDSDGDFVMDRHDDNEQEENDTSLVVGAGGGGLLPQARVREFLKSEAILERLEIARSCGRATHSVLQEEAERTYNQLTEDVRSC